MKWIAAIGFAMASGVTLAAQPIEIPVEVTTVKMEGSGPYRWEVSRSTPHDKAITLIAENEKAGGVCHEIADAQIVVCLFTKNSTVGIDWEAMSKDLLKDA